MLAIIILFPLLLLLFRSYSNLACQCCPHSLLPCLSKKETGRQGGREGERERERDRDRDRDRDRERERERVISLSFLILKHSRLRIN